MEKAVIDTDVLVSGLLSANEKPGQIINALVQGSFLVCYSDAIMEEYTAVLARPKFHFSPAHVQKLLQCIALLGYHAIPSRSTLVLPDESDRVFYDTATASGAYLVTGNSRHYPDEPFILAPAQFLARIFA